MSSTTQQPKALRLTHKYEVEGFLNDHRYAKDHWCTEAVAELHRQHERIQELEKFLYEAGPVPKLNDDEQTCWLTVVYRNIQPGKEAQEIGMHSKVCAVSWSHALQERDALKRLLAAGDVEPLRKKACLHQVQEPSVAVPDEHEALVADARFPASESAAVSVLPEPVREALEEAASVLSSINTGAQHAVTVNDEVCYWQRQEWTDWAKKEVLPKVRSSLLAVVSDPTDPMDWPLPCDVAVGGGTMRKGVKLRMLVLRMKTLYKMATGRDADEVASRTPEQRSGLLSDFQARIDGNDTCDISAPAAQARVALLTAIEDSGQGLRYELNCLVNNGINTFNVYDSQNEEFISGDWGTDPVAAIDAAIAAQAAAKQGGGNE